MTEDVPRAPEEPANAGIAGPEEKPSLLARFFIFLVHVYQHTFRYLLGGHCRFQPSCSNYALEVLKTHGAWDGALRSVRRVSRCHPFHPGGYDPPPPRVPRVKDGDRA